MFSYIFNLLNPLNHTEEKSGIVISLFYAILFYTPTFICISLIINICGGIVGEIIGYDLMLDKNYQKLGISVSLIVVYIVWYIISPTICTILLLLSLSICCGYVIMHIKINFGKIFLLSTVLYIVYLISVYIRQNSEWYFNSIVDSNTIIFESSNDY